MPAPVTLPPAPTNQSNTVFTINSTDDVLQQRALGLVLAMQQRYPLRVKQFDIWHPIVLARKGIADLTLWARLAENVSIYFKEHHERWFEASTGAFLHKVVGVIIPVGVHLRAQDELVSAGTRMSYIAADVMRNDGLDYAIIDNAASRFQQPPANAGTSRVMTMGALIG